MITDSKIAKFIECKDCPTKKPKDDPDYRKLCTTCYEYDYIKHIHIEPEKFEMVFLKHNHKFQEPLGKR